jgi:hypothetical protein
MRIGCSVLPHLSDLSTRINTLITSHSNPLRGHRSIPRTHTKTHTHTHTRTCTHTHTHTHTHARARARTALAMRFASPRHTLGCAALFSAAGRALLRPFKPLAAVALRSSTNGAHDRRSGVNSAQNSGSEPHCRTAVGVPSILRALYIAVVRRDCDRWRSTVRPTARTDDRTASLAVDGRAPAPCELRPS